MRRQLQLPVVLLAWFMATGSHWHLVQTFAWGRMIATYSQTMPLREAVRLTFTPDNMCGVCELVNAAQHAQGDAALPAGASLDTKIFLIFQPAPAPFAEVPAIAAWSLSDRRTPPSERAAPPLPPPRALV